MRPEPGGTCYENIAVYVDDLAIAAKDPQAFCNELKKKYNLKLKGVGPLEYHLGCTYKKDPDGTLAADPRRYVNKILESYERMFNQKPRKSRPPLEGGDHPELDTSELCDEHQTKQFQTLIGQLQWLISLGRFDIAVHVMSLSRFRAQPRKGHLDRAKRIVGYLLFLPDGAIRFRIGEPDFSSLKDQEYDWTRTVYSGACEQIPHEIPKPLGKHVQTTHYVDANLHHDLATGKAVTAALHFLNQTPIDAYTKRQSTVETATYGYEFVAARTAVDQIIGIRTTLRYLGVPIRDKSYMFGDNKSVVTSSTIPNSTISKRHHLASYRRVREAIAAKFISFHWKDGKSNPADILSNEAQLDSTRPITYRSYFDLLKDAAFHLDQATKRGNKIRHTNVHFSGPNDEDEHQNLSSDDPRVIQQEDVSSETPEPLSYSVFQSHFQGSSTSNTQKIFLPKPIWEKLSKDQQQMIIDHNRSLPKSGSSSFSTPNKSPSPLPHKPTPQQTVKSQQVHTHQSDQSTADTTKIETTPSDPLLAMVHQSIHTSADDASDITKVLSAKRSRQIQVCKHYIFQHANHTNNQLVDRGANGGLAGSDMQVIYKTHRKINISGIDNHEVTGLDVVTAATLLNTSLGKVIGIFNEYAYLGKGSSIHSSGQLEWFKTLVDEKSIKVGGT